MADGGQSGGDGSALRLVDEADLVEALQAAVQEVFETMVFTVCESASVDDSELDPEVHVPGHHVDDGSGKAEFTRFDIDAEVGFTGELNGRVLLRCSAEGAMDIARGLLMLDDAEAINVAEAADALGECANMVTGVVKTRMLDPLGHFDLTVPKINSNPELSGKARAGTLAYKLKQGIIAVEVWLERNGS